MEGFTMNRTKPNLNHRDTEAQRKEDEKIRSLEVRKSQPLNFTISQSLSFLLTLALTLTLTLALSEVFADTQSISDIPYNVIRITDGSSKDYQPEFSPD